MITHMDEDPLTNLPFSKRIKQAWHSARLWILLGLTIVGTVIALSLPNSPNQSGVVLEVNDVSSQDILAPSDFSYSSGVLTELARSQAAESIEDIYDPPDGVIARQQVEQLHIVLDYLDSIRSDTFATNDEKLADISATEDVRLDSITAQKVLDLSEVRWQIVKLEAINILEEVLRTEIRDYQIDEARRTIPALVGISLTEDQADLVVQFASPFVAPNSTFNTSETNSAIEQARRDVASVVNSYATGETIIGRGQVVTDLQIEALQEFGLLKSPNPWGEIGIRGILAIVLASCFVLYMGKLHPEHLQNFRLLGAFAILFIVSTVAMQLMIPGRTVLPYVFPTALLPLIFATLVGPGLGIVSAILTGAIAGFLASRGLELTLYIIISGSMAALVIGRAERLSAFFYAGLTAAISAMAIVVIFRIPDPATDLIGKLSLLAAGTISGLLSASLAFGMLLLIGSLLGITTSLQLMELARPDHPLLQMILRNAPGTYQHSLQVANLAEQAARVVGANPLLTRVGALYHDVGKATRPQFYIENQVPGQNVHDQMDPTTSAGVIVEHVQAGLELAQKHHLPEDIQAFIPEHHGTLETSYQYHSALEAVGGDESKLDHADFRYPGPRPKSKETALLMLADSVEAKARADSPANREEIDKLVRWVIENRLENGQLDNVDLTLRDLDTIRKSFAGTLKGIYHPRVLYPKPTDEEKDELPQEEAPGVRASNQESSAGEESQVEESRTESPSHTSSPTPQVDEA
jgi:putative nucleotidyltransferase with HDIG domain